MNYKKSSIDIIAEAVAAMEFPVVIKSQAVNSDGSITLTVCDIYHTQIGFNVTIDGNLYEIIDFSFENSTITVRGDLPITVTEFELYHPFFFHGTLAATNVEVNQEQNANDKTPMIWLREFPLEDEFNTSTSDPIERTLGDLEAFFLSQSDSKEFQTDETYTKVVMPMRRLQENFRRQMESMIGIFNTIDWKYRVKNYAKLAVYASGKSDKKAFFVDDLAGCAMPLTGIQIFESGICASKC